MLRLQNPRLMIALLVMLLVTTADAWACPGCKEALASEAGAQGEVVRGYFWSILFMMSMPFTVLSLFGAYMYREVRRARAVRMSRSRQPESVEVTRGAESVQQ